MEAVAAVRRWFERRVERAREEPVLFAATAFFVGLGLFLRARGYLWQKHGLWLDEALWAILVMRDPLSSMLFRPIGFMATSKVLGVVLGPTEEVLRLLAWVAGMATLLIAPGLGRRLFQAPAARLLFVAVLALHPAVIDLAKEFKPYSVSLFGHVCLLFLLLRYLGTQSLAHLAWLLLVALVGTLFAQDMVLMYPGVFLVLGWDALTRRRDRLPWVIGGAFAVLVVVFAEYWFMWRHIGAEETVYWGDKYGIFYTKNQQMSRFRWWLKHFLDFLDFPASRHKYWDAEWVSEQELITLARVESWVWLVLEAVGFVVLLVRRRFRTLTLVVLPIATLTIMNLLGHWPYGPFRANLFTVLYFTAIACAALDVPRAALSRWPAVLPAFVLVFAPLALFDRSWNDRKKALCYDSELPRVLQTLTEIEAPPRRGAKKALLIMSRRTCTPYEYYTQEHPRTAPKYRKRLARTFEDLCFRSVEELDTELPKLVPATGHAWFLTDFSMSELHALERRQTGIVFSRRYYAKPHKLFELTQAAPRGSNERR